MIAIDPETLTTFSLRALIQPSPKVDTQEVILQRIKVGVLDIILTIDFREFLIVSRALQILTSDETADIRYRRAIHSERSGSMMIIP